jgi:hypothetical protein
MKRWKDEKSEGAVFRSGAFCSIAAGVKLFLGGEHLSSGHCVVEFPGRRDQTAVAADAEHGYHGFYCRGKTA